MKYTFEDRGSRGMGRTTVICESAKAIGATVVCANWSHAKLISKTHGVNAVSYHENMSSRKGPYLFDHYAIDSMAQGYEQRIVLLEQQLADALRAKDKCQWPRIIESGGVTGGKPQTLSDLTSSD